MQTPQQPNTLGNASLGLGIASAALVFGIGLCALIGARQGWIQVAATPLFVYAPAYEQFNRPKMVWVATVAVLLLALAGWRALAGRRGGGPCGALQGERATFG